MGAKDTTFCPGSLDDLEQFIRRSAVRGTAFVRVRLTAEVANLILTSTWNDGNRPIREWKIVQLIGDMTGGGFGGWSQIGFGCFGGKVKVGNLQHRMHAQIRSQTTQEYEAVIFSSESEFNDYVKNCDPDRSLADALKCMGAAATKSDAKLAEQVINFALKFSSENKMHMSQIARFDWAMRYIKSIRYVTGLPRRKFKTHVLSALMMGHAKHGPATERLVDLVLDGADLHVGTPALALAKELASMNEAVNWRAKDRAAALVLKAVRCAFSESKCSLTRVQADTLKEYVAQTCGKAVGEAWARRNVVKVATGAAA